MATPPINTRYSNLGSMFHAVYGHYLLSRTMYQINRASQRYKWPSWIIFDYNFRQKAAERGQKEWATLDPSMYADCFNGQAKTPDAWYPNCHSLDHSTDNCPLQAPPPPPSKRPKPGLSNKPTKASSR